MRSLAAVSLALLVPPLLAADMPPPSGDAIVAKDAKWEVLFTRTAKITGGLTEGPATAPDGSIYFSDIPVGDDKGMILRFDPKTRQTTVFKADSGKSNGLKFDARGFLIACEGSDQGGRRVARYDVKTGASTTLADRYQGKRFNAPNDLAIDRQGRIYFSDPRYLGDEPRELEHRAVYRIDTSGTVVEVTHECEKPNGVALSPDQRTLYVIDHNNGQDKIDASKPSKKGAMKVYAFPLGGDGLVSGPRKTLVDFGAEDGGDGMCVDAKGNIYIAARSLKRPGILVIDPTGKEVAFIPTGASQSDAKEPVGRPSNVCFGIGAESKTLYATVDFSLWRIRLKADGATLPFQKKAGITPRVPWTMSRVRGSPDPPSPYRTELAFPKLKFDEPLDMTSVPGSERLFVVERYGRILSFSNDPNVEKPDLLLDLNQHLGRTEPKTLAAYGFAAHPQFAKNGFVYVTYVLASSDEKEMPKGTRLSRFQVQPGEPPSCDPKTEQILLEWPSGGHNGGCLKFGPDGYLYVATGDSSGIADQYLTGQNLGVIPGKILRLDVDHTSPDKPYAIPSENPFVDRPGARPEIWAYGLRQPWKMSFDRSSGDLWAGNVGQDLWEQIYRIERGGNYGWSVLEGSHPFRPERPRGPTPILMPVVEQDHANFRSITGGFVYHGKRLADLAGAYIYGDYDTGRIWMLRYDRDKKTVTDHRELYDSSLRLVGFGEDHAGELYLLDHQSGKISRLVPNPVKNTSAQFPRKLSETGLFASTKDHRIAPGVIPYSVIAPQWSDGASKERFLAIPGDGQIEFETMTYPQPAPGAPAGWKFPDGAVLAETLSLDTDAGRRRLETRILHHERLTGNEEVGDQYWQGYTYVWNDAQTDAVLLEDPQGLDRTLTVRGKRTQTWHVPSRTECTACHNMAAKYVLGVQTLQLPRNQLKLFEDLGLFTLSLPAPVEELPRLADYRDARQDLNLRARAYLHANCAHCHRKWGGGNAEFQLLATLDLADTGTLVRPGQGTFNIANARVLAPHDPYRSVLLYRMSTLGPGRMPRIGSSVVDDAGVNLLHDWLASLPGPGIIAAAPRGHDGLSSTSGALRLAVAAGKSAAPDANLVAQAMKSDQAEIRDLFERFLPEEKRIKRLGAVVRPEKILALKGDAERGRKLFFTTSGVQCRNCHKIGTEGTEVGPNLDQIGKKYDRAQILENILNPSKQIEDKYLTYVVETKQGQVHSGILVSKSADKVVLKDANNKLIEVPAGDVDVLAAQQKSLMPDLLLRDLTAEQVADLTAFLSSLK